MDSQAQRSIAGCLVVDREAKKWGQTQPTVCSFSSSQNSWMEHITGNPRQKELFVINETEEMMDSRISGRLEECNRIKMEKNHIYDTSIID
ncbi:DNA replication and repair protein RecF [Dirofilaria immitis]